MKFKLIIFFLVILTIATRSFRIETVPPNLSNDEISIAYDAYSVSRTLRDEHNHFLPLSFQSHGTYKAPLAIYLAIPSTIILGNSELSVRLPSILAGFLTVFLLGALIFELTKNRTLAFLGSFILAVTPVHIHYSRMATEANIALFLVVLGLYLFFYGLNHTKYFATIISFAAFGLSLYAYHTQWGFTPLLVFLLLFFYRKELLKQKLFLIGAGLFVLLLIPIFVTFTQNIGTTSRENTQMIFQDPFVIGQLSNNSINILQKFQVVLKTFISNYSNYNNPQYIFFKGMQLLGEQDPFQVGLFLFPFLISFFVGLFLVKKYFGAHKNFIYSLLIISPLVPALTTGGMNNPRNLISVAPIILIISAGSLFIWESFRDNKFLKFLKWGVLFLISISFFYFMVIYYGLFPIYSGVNYQYGYKQIAEYIKPNYNEFEKIIIDPRFGETNRYSGVPHLYIPYFTNLDPNQLLRRKDIKDGVIFDKYEIREINWNLENLKPDYLYVVPNSNQPEKKDLQKLLEINLPNNQPAFDLYTY